jgi:hypothetical protein
MNHEFKLPFGYSNHDLLDLATNKYDICTIGKGWILNISFIATQSAFLQNNIANVMITRSD